MQKRTINLFRRTRIKYTDLERKGNGDLVIYYV